MHHISQKYSKYFRVETVTRSTSETD